MTAVRPAMRNLLVNVDKLPAKKRAKLVRNSWKEQSA